MRIEQRLLEGRRDHVMRPNLNGKQVLLTDEESRPPSTPQTDIEAFVEPDEVDNFDYHYYYLSALLAIGCSSRL